MTTKLKTLKGVNINFNLRQQKPANKQTSIHCILRYNKQRVIIYDIEKTEPRNWNNKSQLVRGNQRARNGQNINDFLKDRKLAFDKIFADYVKAHNKYPDPAYLKEQCLKVVNNELTEDSKAVTDLIEFIESFIAETKTGVRLNPSTGKPMTPETIRIYANVLDSIKDFKSAKRFNTSLDNITLDFYGEYTDYLKFEKKFATNSIAKYIKNIKTFMHDARDRGFTANDQFKSKRFKVITEETDTIYLNTEELESMYALDLSDKPRLERVRDLFLVGCWSGLRFSDYKDISAKDIDGDFMTIKALKTQKEVVIPIHSTIKSIMTRYQGKTNNSLPPTISNVKMNEYLKEVAEEAKLNEIIQLKYTKAGKTVVKNSPKFKLITTHTARRSFATNMYLMGVPSITIMAITGHRTEKSFMRYIRVTPAEHANKLKELWNSKPASMKLLG
ncbi:MAG: tyrosine-type recombinase/integrase [Daejeonella sp.]